MIRCSTGDGRLLWLCEVLADEGLMKILSAFKAERTVATLLAEPNSNTPAAKKALQSLAKAGPGSIPVLIDAIGGADKFQVVGMIEALSEKVSEANFKHFIDGLKHPNQRCVAGVARALADSRKFNPNKLFKYLTMEDVSKSAILDVLRAHSEDLNVREVLKAAYDLEPQEKAAMFQLVAKLAKEDLIPDMIGRMGGSDQLARVHLIHILSRFKRPEVKNVLLEQLKDTNKYIRKAAIEGLLNMDADGVDIALVCSLLHDPDFEVQGKAVDLIIHLRQPDTFKHLIDALKDESEFARRCAVEVLNELADVSTIKHLLAVVSDDDWWVRTRAADALATIGGAKVIDAVLILVQDEDENVRRSAIEILNQTKDERAVGQLIKAT
jgi:serine/threonine-protein kinase